MQESGCSLESDPNPIFALDYLEATQEVDGKAR